MYSNHPPPVSPPGATMSAVLAESEDFAPRLTPFEAAFVRTVIEHHGVFRLLVRPLLQPPAELCRHCIEHRCRRTTEKAGEALPVWKKMREMAEAGVDRATVSCDSLMRHRFADMTRRDALDKVLAGLMAAERAAFASGNLTPGRSSRSSSPASAGSTSTRRFRPAATG